MRKNSNLSDSTAASTPENNSVSSVILNDKVRYERKGYGLFFAVVIFLGYFTFFPVVLKHIWNDILSIGNRYVIQAIMTVIYPLVVFILGNLMMWYIYVAKIPFFERYRINNKKWPWEENAQEWRKVLKKSINQIAFNVFIVQLPSVIIDMYIAGSKCRFDLESFPGYGEILKQVTFMMLVEDFAFYWSHRLLHTPFFYKKVHKVHHEYNNTVAIAAIYAHPVEYLLGNILPVAYGFMILGGKCHFATYLIWITLREFETIDGHCGYEFSWSPYRLLPLSGSSEYHNYHHSHNVGTFGSFFTFWDTVFGTNKDYFQYKAKKEKEEQLIKMRNKYSQEQEYVKKVE